MTSARESIFTEVDVFVQPYQQQSCPVCEKESLAIPPSKPHYKKPTKSQCAYSARFPVFHNVSSLISMLHTSMFFYLLIEIIQYKDQNGYSFSKISLKE